MPKVHAAAGHGSARAGRSRRVASSLAEINVVPLVDVMLVLLIIFMVTAPLLQRGIDVNLPTAVRANAIQGERIFINVPAAFRKDRMVYLASEPIRLAILRERIRQKVENQTDKQVFLRVDGGLQIQDERDVMDQILAAGVSKIGLVSKLPGEK
jgi:biopolymer transport protein TolR